MGAVKAKFIAFIEEISDLHEKYGDFSIEAELISDLDIVNAALKLYGKRVEKSGSDRYMVTENGPTNSGEITIPNPKFNL